MVMSEFDDFKKKRKEQIGKHKIKEHYKSLTKIFPSLCSQGLKDFIYTSFEDYAAEKGIPHTASIANAYFLAFSDLLENADEEDKPLDLTYRLEQITLKATEYLKLHGDQYLRSHGIETGVPENLYSASIARRAIENHPDKRLEYMERIGDAVGVHYISRVCNTESGSGFSVCKPEVQALHLCELASDLKVMLGHLEEEDDNDLIEHIVNDARLHLKYVAEFGFEDNENMSSLEKLIVDKAHKLQEILSSFPSNEKDAQIKPSPLEPDN